MSKPLIQIGRYVLCDALARGGMATVHLGRLVGPAGFARTVAIKRLHPHLATDPAFVAMLLDEARLAARIQHPNVAATMDVVAKDGELFVVMEYLHGETLGRLLKVAASRKQRIPPNVAVAIAVGALTGLHAAHEARGETGEPLGLVHRDVSPQNIMVRRDGTAVVVDFGVAKAAGRFQVTEEGQVKGKLPYMATEQVRGQALSRRVDIYAAAAVLWEMLVGERLVTGVTEAEVLEKLLFGTFATPSSRVAGIPEALDAVVMKGLARRADDRWATALEMALALEDALPPATPTRVAAWLEELAGDVLNEREKRVSALESGITSSVPALSAEAAAKLAVAAEPPAAAPPPAREPKPSEAEPTTIVAAAEREVSTVGPIAGVPTRSSFVWLGAAIAAVVLGVGVLVAFTRGSSRAEGAALPSASATTAARASASADAPPPAVSTAVVASASASASAPPSASAAAPEVSAKPAAKRPASPPPAKPPAAKANCAVPYTVDATGKRIYKRECL